MSGRTLMALVVAALAGCTERGSMEILCDSPMICGVKLDPWGKLVPEAWRWAEGRVKHPAVKELMTSLAGNDPDFKARVLRERAARVGLNTCPIATGHDFHLDPYCASEKSDAPACRFERQAIDTWIRGWGRDLSSRDDSIVQEALHALRRLGTRAAPVAPQILAAISDRPDLREAAVELAIQLGPRTSLEAIRLLLSPKMPREVTSEMLRKFLPHRDVVVPAARLAVRDPNPLVHRCFAELLANMSHDETDTTERRRAAARVLLELLQKDPVADVREVAAGSLRHYGGVGLDREIVRALTAAAWKLTRKATDGRDPEATVARIATYSLWPYPEAVVRPILERIAKKHPDVGVRSSAERTLARIAREHELRGNRRTEPQR